MSLIYDLIKKIMAFVGGYVFRSYRSRKAVLESLHRELNKLLTIYQKLSASAEVDFSFIENETLESDKKRFVKLYEEIFFDSAILKNRNLSQRAKDIIEELRNAREETWGAMDEFDFSYSVAMSRRIESLFSELIVIVEYAIKKLPYPDFRSLNPINLFRRTR